MLDYWKLRIWEVNSAMIFSNACDEPASIPTYRESVSSRAIMALGFLDLWFLKFMSSFFSLVKFIHVWRKPRPCALIEILGGKAVLNMDDLDGEMYEKMWAPEREVWNTESARALVWYWVPVTERASQAPCWNAWREFARSKQQLYMG